MTLEQKSQLRADDVFVVQWCRSGHFFMSEVQLVYFHVFDDAFVFLGNQRILFLTDGRGLKHKPSNKNARAVVPLTARSTLGFFLLTVCVRTFSVVSFQGLLPLTLLQDTHSANVPSQIDEHHQVYDLFVTWFYAGACHSSMLRKTRCILERSS